MRRPRTRHSAASAMPGVIRDMYRQQPRSATRLGRDEFHYGLGARPWVRFDTVSPASANARIPMSRIHAPNVTETP